MTGIDAKYPNWRQSFPGMILEPSPHYTSLIDPFTIATKCSQNIPICSDSKLFFSGEGAWVWQEQRISGLEIRSIWGKYRKKWALNDSLYWKNVKRNVNYKFLLFWIPQKLLHLSVDQIKAQLKECHVHSNSVQESMTQDFLAKSIYI